MNAYEVNFDGLVGPSHHYAGLAFGNLASIQNAERVANPKAAAKQGLKKMRLLHQLGIKQALLPPHQRPNLFLLHQLGFSGTAMEQINQAAKCAPALLSASFSASSMWTANTATVTPSFDSSDQRVHFTPANLISNLHRQQEAFFSGKLLKCLFNHQDYFVHHPILPNSVATSDEGAANHSRLCLKHNQAGLHLFVYGKQGIGVGQNSPQPSHFPARQTYEASSAVARAHLLSSQHLVFACQHPQSIDQGVFHNDVIAVANENVLLLHQDAFVSQAHVIDELQRKANFDLVLIEVSNDDLSVSEAVSTYLFNSQLVSQANGQMALIAPIECEQNPRTHALITHLLEQKDNPIDEVHFIDLRQSMHNGGGPACLRLRVLLSEDELNAMHQGVLITEPLLNQLDAWVERHYRSHLLAKDLLDPLLIDEILVALDELTRLLDLGAIYPFQQMVQS